jgi:hypothetical protein
MDWNIPASKFTMHLKPIYWLEMNLPALDTNSRKFLLKEFSISVDDQNSTNGSGFNPKRKFT